jgi:hypothetical protein
MEGIEEICSFAEQKRAKDSNAINLRHTDQATCLKLALYFISNIFYKSFLTALSLDINSGMAVVWRLFISLSSQ